MAHVRMQWSASGNPFRCYVGRMVSVEQRPHVVECYEVQGRSLLFRLREVGSSAVTHVTVVELLDLMEKRGG